MLSRKFIRNWLILLAVVAAIALIGSCTSSTEPTGKDVINQQPKIEIVNIPPNESHFTTNPQIYWYATDKDGRITAYEYAVVPAAMVVAAGVDTSNDSLVIEYAKGHVKAPVAGKDCVPESCWQWIDVEQSDDPNRQTIRLFADVDPSVKLFQYFYVRAVDNDSLRSGIDFRLYSRTNHAPDTEIKTTPDSTGYYDRPDTSAVYKGVSFDWNGTDKVDYPDDTQEPTFEYFWQVFGPYQRNEIFSASGSGLVFDPARVDTTNSLKIVKQSYDTLTDGVWVKKTNTKIFGVWPGQSDTTRSGYFVLKVTARDDAFVSDSTPAFVPFLMIDGKREKDLMVYCPAFGATSEEAGNIWYYLFDGNPGIDSTMQKMKDFYSRVISSAGYDPNELRMLTVPADSIHPDRWPTKLELARYKVVLLLADGRESHMPESLFVATRPYMDFGGNVWIWSPAPFAVYYNAVSANMNSLTPTQLKKFSIPYYYFDVVGEYFAGWSGSVDARNTEWGRNRNVFLPTNEEFIGGMALGTSGMPEFEIDWSKINSTYITLKDSTFAPPCTLFAAPHTSYFQRSAFSEPLWLYNSRWGDFVPDSLQRYFTGLHGRVVGLRYDSFNFKTAVYGFSMYMLPEEKADSIFARTMRWFLE